MFTGDLNDKTYDDVLTFLQQGLPEGTRLDYKRDFPTSLEKTLAAMANTEGGVILIGVAEADRVPLVPPTGISIGQAQERVVSIAYQAIREPLFPEIAAIPLSDDPLKCVVVVRVQPSERAPHAVGKDASDLYVRVSSQSMPVGDLETRMGIERIDWLLRRREQGQALLADADARCRALLTRPMPRQSSGQDAHASFLQIVRPTLPHAEPIPPNELNALAARQQADRYGNSYPDSQLRHVASGIVSRNEPRETYLDVTGLSACTDSVPIQPDQNVSPPSQQIIYPSWLRQSVVHLQWAGTSARAAGRGGTLTILAELRGIRGAALMLSERRMFFEPDDHRALQNDVTATVQATAEQLSESAPAVAVTLLRQVAYAFNHDVQSAAVDRWVQLLSDR